MSETKLSTGMTRRDFLKTMGVLAGTAAAGP
ncbi:MAG: twin-arginine translocation signal domain-containing protein, partial [Chloroflexi bacterium]